MQIAAGDTPILEFANVRVTNHKVEINGTTYFLANITSVKVVKDDNIRTYGMIAALAGVVVLAAGFAGLQTVTIVLGVVIAAISAAMIRFGLAWEVVLTTGAAEQHALRSSDKSTVVRVLAAINIAVENRMATR